MGIFAGALGPPPQNGLGQGFTLGRLKLLAIKLPGASCQVGFSYCWRKASNFWAAGLGVVKNRWDMNVICRG